MAFKKFTITDLELYAACTLLIVSIVFNHLLLQANLELKQKLSLPQPEFYSETQVSEITTNWTTYETTLLTFKHPKEMTAGKSSARNNIAIMGPTNKYDKEYIFKPDNTYTKEVTPIKKTLVDGQEAFYRNVYTLPTRYFQGINNTQVVIENMRFFEDNKWHENGTLHINIHIDGEKTRSEQIASLIINTIRLNVPEEKITLKLGGLSFEIPPTWWYQYGINETLKSEFYHINTATNANPFHPQRDNVSLDTSYEVIYYREGKVSSYADDSYFSDIKETPIKINNIEGLLFENTVSTEPELNLHNWRYGPGDTIGTASFITKEGAYTLRGNVTSDEQRSDFDQILSTFEFLD